MARVFILSLSSQRVALVAVIVLFESCEIAFAGFSLAGNRSESPFVPEDVAHVSLHRRRCRWLDSDGVRRSRAGPTNASVSDAVAPHAIRQVVQRRLRPPGGLAGSAAPSECHRTLPNVRPDVYPRRLHYFESGGSRIPEVVFEQRSRPKEGVEEVEPLDFGQFPGPLGLVDQSPRFSEARGENRRFEPAVYQHAPLDQRIQTSPSQRNPSSYVARPKKA